MVWCPICSTAGTVQPWRIIRGVQWYICTTCFSKFTDPIIVNTAIASPDEVTQAEAQPETPQAE